MQQKEREKKHYGVAQLSTDSDISVVQSEVKACGSSCRPLDLWFPIQELKIKHAYRKRL